MKINLEVKAKQVKYLRIIFHCLSALILIYLTGNLVDSYRSLERENKILLEQKEAYERIIRLEKTDSLEKESLFKILNITDSSLEDITNKKELGMETHLWIWILSIFLLFNISKYISRHIEKLTEAEKK
ncbi:hypothetical protein [Sabulibacter ruber]|uniref:hypothetical protein n=1 Tax=Sabulibacter ruber TaxID=2811901 RepID=UPI001A95C134|nr:hypothetical protein [Sabulibacter ruber]